MSALAPLEMAEGSRALVASLFPVDDLYEAGLHHPDVTAHEASRRIPAWFVHLFEFADDTGTGTNFREELTGKQLATVQDAYALRSCRIVAEYLQRYCVSTALKALRSEDAGVALYWAFEGTHGARRYTDALSTALRIQYPHGRRSPTWRTVDAEYASLVREALCLEPLPGWGHTSPRLLGQRLLRVRMCLTMRAMVRRYHTKHGAAPAKEAAYRELPLLLDACALAAASLEGGSWVQRRAMYTQAWERIFEALCDGDVGDGRPAPSTEARILAAGRAAYEVDTLFDL